MSPSKRCKGCGLTKPIDGFYKAATTKDGRVGKCKDCDRISIRARMRVWRAKNPERSRESGRRSRRNEALKFPLRVRLREDKRAVGRYGLTLEDYARILDSQGGRCAICPKRKPGGKFRRFVVDHDHFTGRVRGLLCGSCNTALGMFKDDPEILLAAIRYLEVRHASVSA